MPSQVFQFHSYKVTNARLVASNILLYNRASIFLFSITGDPVEVKVGYSILAFRDIQEADMVTTYAMGVSVGSRG